MGSVGDSVSQYKVSVINDDKWCQPLAYTHRVREDPWGKSSSLALHFKRLCNL